MLTDIGTYLVIDNNIYISFNLYYWYQHILNDYNIYLSLNHYIILYYFALILSNILIHYHRITYLLLYSINMILWYVVDLLWVYHDGIAIINWCCFISSQWLDGIDNLIKFSLYRIIKSHLIPELPRIKLLSTFLFVCLLIIWSFINLILGFWIFLFILLLIEWILLFLFIFLLLIMLCCLELDVYVLYVICKD